MWRIFILILLLTYSSTASNEAQNYGIASTSSRLSRSRITRQKLNKRYWDDMWLSNIETFSFIGPPGTSENRKIYFDWIDPNNNSTTCCAATWTEIGSNSNRPTKYIACDATGKKEHFQWYFLSYVNMSQFTLRLGHQYTDSLNFPPPWDTPQIFSTVDISLQCVSEGESQSCQLPLGSRQISAPINGASD